MKHYLAPPVDRQPLKLWLTKQTVAWLRAHAFASTLNYLAETIVEDAARAGRHPENYCPCGCRKLLTGRQRAASAACRQRLSRARRSVTDRCDKTRPLTSGPPCGLMQP